MSRAPAERPRSAGQLVEGLQTAFGHGSPGANGLGSPPARAGVRRSGAKGVAGAGALAAGAGGLASAAAAGDPAEHPTTRTATQATRVRDGRRPPPGTRPAPVDDRGNRRSAWLAPLLLGLVVAAILATVLGAGGGAQKPAASHRTQTRAKARTRTGTTAHKSTTSPVSAWPGGNRTPVMAVERFYHLAAAHRFRAAWALADPTFRDQLGGYDSFVSGQQGDIRIIFDSARVISRSPGSATVEITTTSVRTDGTEQCGGTVALLSGGSGWLLHQININCQPAYASHGHHPHPGRGHGKHS